MVQCVLLWSASDEAFKDGARVDGIEIENMGEVVVPEGASDEDIEQIHDLIASNLDRSGWLYMLVGHFKLDGSFDSDRHRRVATFETSKIIQA